MKTSRYTAILLLAFATTQAMALPAPNEIPQDPISIAKAIAQLIAEDCKARSKGDLDKFSACFNARMTEAINRMQPPATSRSQV